MDKLIEVIEGQALTKAATEGVGGGIEAPKAGESEGETQIDDLSRKMEAAV